MNEETERFVRFIESRLNDLTSRLSEDSLVVAVFGPGIANDNPGSRKRQQIVDTLNMDGHEAFTPEDFLDVQLFDLIWLEQEELLLGENRVDYVIVLLTEDSIGAFAEIGRISGDPAIVRKTGILYPQQHYSPNENLLANTVTRFPDLHLYTEDEIETCQVVAKCRDWVADEQNDIDQQQIPWQKF